MKNADLSLPVTVNREDSYLELFAESKTPVSANGKKSFAFVWLGRDIGLAWWLLAIITAVSKKVVIVNSRYWNRKELWVHSL